MRDGQIISSYNFPGTCLIVHAGIGVNTCKLRGNCHGVTTLYDNANICVFQQCCMLASQWRIRYSYLCVCQYNHVFHVFLRLRFLFYADVVWNTSVSYMSRPTLKNTTISAVIVHQYFGISFTLILTWTMQRISHPAPPSICAKYHS